MQSVTVLCPNNRRVAVKTNPTITLQLILEEACKKQGFNPLDYGLRRQNGKSLDLTLPIRLTGLPNNCTLETFEAEKTGLDPGGRKVEIAMQFPDGSRFSRSFLARETMWDVMRSFFKQFLGVDMLAQPEAEGLTPVIQYISGEIVGEFALQHHTLLSLGLLQKSLLRFSLRKVSEEELAHGRNAIVEEDAKREKLNAVFEKKAQQIRSEENAISVAKAAAISRNTEIAGSNCNPSTSSLPVTSLQPFSSLQDTSSCRGDVTQEGVVSSSDVGMPDNCESSRPSTDAMEIDSGLGQRGENRSDRLAVLQSMLATVDSSIENNTDIPFVDVGGMARDVMQHITMNIPQPGSRGASMIEFKFPEETRGMDLTGSPSSSTTNTATVGEVSCERHTKLFTKQAQSENIADEDSEEFFNVTAHDVQVMHQRLTEQKNMLENRALLSDGYIKERNRVRKAAAWRRTVLRVLFANGYVLQGTFLSGETVGRVYDWIRSTLAFADNRQFNLVMPPNFVLDKLGDSLMNANLAPCAQLTCRIRDASLALDEVMPNEFIARTIVTEADANQSAKHSLSENKQYVPIELSALEKGGEGASFGPADSQLGKSPPPKWLKLSGKR